jgi:hypothetical protein
MKIQTHQLKSASLALLAAVAALALSAHSSAAQTTIYSDPLTAPGTTGSPSSDFPQNWTFPTQGYEGSQPNGVYNTAGFYSVNGGGNSLLSANGIAAIPLGTTLTNNWTASWDVWSPVDSTQCIGLVNSNLTQGYLVYYNASDAVNGPGGFLGVGVLNLSSPGTLWSDYQNYSKVGEIGWYNNGGTGPVSDETVQNDISLSWNSAGGALTMGLNGTALETVNDTSFNSFSDVLINTGGTGSAQGFAEINNITVTTASVPEPGSVGLLALGLGICALGSALARRMRRSPSRI